MKIGKWLILVGLGFWGGLFGMAMLVSIAGVSATAAGQHPGGELPPGVGLIWPAQGPITSRFGVRDNPTDEEAGLEHHWGLDIGVPEGTPVLAATSGWVSLAGVAGNYGNLVVIASPGRDVVTWYGHLSDFAVSTGQTVTQGQVIGFVGSTGRSTAPHLHFEIRPQGGSPVDPLPFLQRIKPAGQQPRIE